MWNMQMCSTPKLTCVHKIWQRALKNTECEAFQEIYDRPSAKFLTVYEMENELCNAAKTQRAKCFREKENDRREINQHSWRTESGSDFSWTWITEKMEYQHHSLTFALCISFYLDYIEYIK